MIKALIFDMDGVMVDTEPLSMKTHMQIVKKYGKNNKEYTNEFHMSALGLNIKNVISKLKDEYKIDLPDDVLLKKRNLIFSKLVDEELVYIDGLVDLLKFIKKSNLKCAVATGSNRSITTKILKKFNIDRYFDFIICSEDTKIGKPDPWIYLEVMKNINVNPFECVILEDSKNGINAALKAEANLIIINSQYKVGDYNPKIIGVEKDLKNVPQIIKNLLDYPRS